MTQQERAALERVRIGLEAIDAGATVEQAAFQAGFCQQSNFSVRCKAKLGSWPSELRGKDWRALVRERYGEAFA